MLGISFEQLRFILHGAGWTLLLSLIGFAGGAAGTAAGAVAQPRRRLGRAATGALIQLVQGIPLPVLMFLCYFGISIAGYDLPSLAAAGLAMTLYAAAFWRRSGKPVSRPSRRRRWEAAECLALRPLQCVRHVVLPQAARIAVAPTVGFLVQIVKNSSYAVVIGFFDLTYSARVVNSTFEPFAVFSIAAVLFAICYPCRCSRTGSRNAARA